MKKIIGVILIAASFAACKNNKTPLTEQARVLSATDAAEFDAFQKWKESKSSKPAKTVVVYREARNNAATDAPVSTKKKGWSKAAKGAAIGAGTGAVAGAIINKRNRAVGAAVGAVLGGGVGYGIGRSQDKKDGRY